MKGMSLPINMIVIIAIAVLVLVVIAAFFGRQIGEGTGSISLETAFQNGCITWRSVYNCEPGATFQVRGYKTPGTPATGPDAFFAQVCAQKFAGGTLTAGSVCYQQCGCG